MKIFFKHAINYPVLKYTTWSQSLGATLLILIILQIFTGILLDLRYDPTIEGAAHSIWFIETHTYNGWFVRQWHVIGTNLLFILLYMHIFRGLHYRLFEWKLRKTW